MKTVFGSHDMTAHVWAQASQYEGRASDGRMFFRAGTLYSYGEHFALGHILDSGVALLNSSGYSVSTRRHASYTSGAVRHRESYDVPDLTRLLRAGIGNPAAIVAHVERHALTIGADAGGFLLRLAKSRRSFATMRATAEAARERDKAAAAKAAHAAKVEKARKLARATDSEFADALTRAAERGGDYLATAARDYRAAGRAAARVLSPRAKARIKSRVAALLSAAAKADARAKAGRALNNWRVRVSELRDESAPAWRRNQSADYLATHGRGLVDADALRQWGARIVARENAARALESWKENKARLRDESAPAHVRMRAAQHLAAHGRGLVNRDALQAFTNELAARVDAEKAAEKAAVKAKWLAGESSYQVGRLYDENGGALIRAKGVERDESGAITGGTLQTSWGADVPLTHAVRAFRFLKLCHATGRTWNANGRTIPVGHFRISQVTPDGFTAGCHVIHWQEVARLAGVLGLADVTADESALVENAAAA